MVALLLAAALGVAASFCVVILDEREQGFRTLFSEAEFEVFGVSLNQASLTEPGWYVRIPLVHQITRYERRLQRYDSVPRDLFTSEKLRIKVDYYVMWRIDDPELFRVSLKTRDAALRQIDNITFAKVRDTLAKHPLAALLSEKRSDLMKTIAEESDRELRERGVRVEDLRIRRTEYQQANLERVYDRMRSERMAVAKRHRAEGEESARTVRAEADLASQKIRADATREATRISGEADAEAASVYAEAYGQDPEFYAFVRSLEAYRAALEGETTLVLTPESPFLKYLLEDGVPTPSAP